MKTQSKLFICYDGSAAATEAIERAAALAPGAHAVVVHAWQPMAAFALSWGMMSGSIGDLDGDIQKSAMVVSAEGTARARAAGLDAAAQTVRAPGTIAHALIEAAELEHAGLIVVGATGRSRIGETFLGSVANYVAHHAQMPVLLVHVPSGVAHARNSEPVTTEAIGTTG
jgi:nucleotide-binding universal stress UspA family protein